MSAAQDAALDAARELFAADVVEATDEVEQPQAVAEEEVPQETDTFEIDPELPDDVKALVDEPDFEEEAEAELAVEEPDDEDDDGYVDPEVRELRKQLKIAQKKAEHFESLRIKADRSKWEEEAGKFFPFADPASIQADSRRGFLRQAKAQHEQIKGAVQPVIDKFQADRAAIRAELEAEVRAEVAAAWGKPTVNPNAVPTIAQDKADKVDAVIQQKGLAAGIKEMLLNQ